MTLAPPRQHSTSPSFFERRWPTAVIFGSFGAVFLPLCALVHWRQDAVVTQAALWAHGVGLGLTHFLLTFTLYLDGRHLGYFRSNRANRLRYLALPAGILGVFALAALLDVRARFPLPAAVVLGLVRFFDFFHVGRQSFGVLQLFKGRARHDRDPSRSHEDNALRKSEGGFFVLLACGQWLTFALGGRFDVHAPWMVAMAVWLIGWFTALCAGVLTRPDGLRDLRARRAFIYFVLQAISGACAVYDTRLYLVGLTLHYVEYHVLMFPRLQAPQTSAHAVDRLFSRIREYPALLYAAVLGVAVCVQASGAASVAGRQLVHLFDGLFLAHYLVEAYLWRFREPFYRELLTPLYFGAATSNHARATSHA